MPCGDDLALASDAKDHRPSDFLIAFSPSRRKGGMDAEELHTFLSQTQLASHHQRTGDLAGGSAFVSKPTQLATAVADRVRIGDLTAAQSRMRPFQCSFHRGFV